MKLYKANKNKQQIQFFINDSDRIWNEERDENNLIGKKKTKSLIDQAAIMEIYARLDEL